MKAVVTGAAGFIGHHVARQLLEQGHEVVGIDRSPSVPTGVKALVGDLATADTRIVDALRSADAVWHLAARPGVRDRSPDIERRRYLDNVVSTHVVCEYVGRDVPLVVTSSSSVYGGAQRGASVIACKEGDDLAPRGGYARSKVRAEIACRHRSEDGGAICIARPFTVAGERQRPDMAIARWIDCILDGRPIRIFGSLDRTRDITDVRQAAAALIQLAWNGMGRTVNVGGGRGFTLQEIVATVEDATGALARVEVVPAGQEEVPATLADTRLLHQTIGWVPETDLPRLVGRQFEHSHGKVAQAV